MIWALVKILRSACVLHPGIYNMDGISGYFSDSSETKSNGNSPAKGTLYEEILKKIRDKNMTTLNEDKKPLEQFNIPLTKQEPEMETSENNLSIALDQPVQSEENMTSDAVISQKSHSRSRSRSRSHSRSRSASRSKRHRSRSDSPRRKRRSRSRSPKNKKSRSRSRSPTPKQRKSSRSETPKGKKRSRSRSPRRSRSRSVKRRHRSRSRSPRRRHRSRSRTPSKRRRRSGSRSRRRRSLSKSRDRRRRQSRSYSRERRGSRRRKHDRSRSRSGSKPRSKSRSPSGERSPSPEQGGSNDEQLNRLECKLDDLVGQVTRLESVQTGMLQALTNLNRLIDIKNRHPSTLAFSAKAVARPRSQTVVTSTSPRVVFPTARVVYTSPEMPSAKKPKQDEPVIGRVFQDEMVEVGSTGSKPPVIIKRELLQKSLATSSDAKVYACKLVKHLFTPEELARSSFEGESKIQGGARTARLDRWRMDAILSQLESDYPGCMSGKGLSVIKTSVNSICRGMRAFFPQQESSVSSSSPRAADVSSSRPPRKSDSHSRSPSPARSVSRSPKRSESNEKSKSKKDLSRSKSLGSERSASVSPERPDKSKKERGSRSPEVKAKSKSHQSRSRSASPQKKQAKSGPKSRSRSRTPRRSSKRRSRSKTPKRRRRHSARSRSRTPPRRGKSSRSRRRSRSKSPSRKKSRSRSRKRSRSPRRSRSRSKKRSRTPKRRKRSRSRSPRKRRPKSRSRSPRRRRSRSRSTKRRHHTRSRSRSISPLIRVRDPAMHAQEALFRRLERAKKLMEMKGKREKEEKEKKIKDGEESSLDKEIAEKATTSLAPLPLMSLTPMAIDPLIQAAAAAAAMQAKVLAETGISVPKYYNPLAVNPVQIAEQTRKRKLLWSGKKEEMAEKPSSNQWENTAFGDDATKAKFRRLMGIKEGEELPESEDVVRQHEEQARLFKQLDQEYQIARVKTHTQRSFGLGFGTMAAAAPPTVATPTAGPVQPTTSGT